jgi:enoyl-CoA hydratase/carnithine racemase
MSNSDIPLAERLADRELLRPAAFVGGHWGRTVGAEEALRIHLADRLAEPGNLLAGAHAFAAQFTENSRPAIALMKSIVSRTFETPFELIAAQGRGAQAISYTTDEHRSSVEQFLKPKS